MKHKKGRKLLSLMLAVAMVIGMIPMFSLTAYAVWWDENQTITESNTIEGSVPIYDDITLTINKGVTLTINCNDEKAGITAKDYTLTLTGGGRLVINGWNNNGVGGIGGGRYSS